jgi:Fic family protein
LADIDRTPYTPFPSFADWRVKAFDEGTFEKFAQLFSDAKTSAKPDVLVRAVDTATRWAAVDTGAIEGLYTVDRGFTYSVAIEAAAWENIHLVKGEKAQHAISDALEGYEYVLDLATGAERISEVWIKQLHAVLCASQETYTVVTAVGPQEHELPKGTYKTQPNSPLNIASGTVHEYAPVNETAPEMHRLVEELNSEQFVTAHPVIQAAYAHYAFVCIHPFADGNGRVARAIASVFLYRQPGVPLVIFADQKAEYLDALERADGGSPDTFVQFVADRAIDTIQMVRTEVGREPAPSLEESLDLLQASLTGIGGLTHNEVDALGARLIEAVSSAFNAALAAHPTRPPVSISLGWSQGSIPKLPAGYRRAPGARELQINATSSPPATAKIIANYGAAIARAGTDVADFIVVAQGGTVLLEIALREVHPTLSTSLIYRLQVVAEHELSTLIHGLVERGRIALEKGGYLAGG